MTTLFKKAWMDMKKTSETKKDNLFEDPDKTIRRIRNNPYDSRYDDDKEDDEKDTKKAVDNTIARNQHYEESEKSTQNGKQVKVTWPPKDQEDRKAKLADEARREKIESERDAKKAEGNTYSEKGSGDYTNDPEYKKLVKRLIRQGMSNSDAQGMADVKFDPRINGSKKSQEETVEKPSDES